MKKVDPTTWTYAENRAANYLADYLTEICEESLTQNVSVYFHRFNVRMKALSCMEKNLKCFYLQLLLEKTKKDISLNFRNKKVCSLMLNVLASIYRNELIKISPDGRRK
ncbi:MAG: hypothetical protein WC428_02460 [Candidatus Paceibacterota bacterium]